MSAMGSAGGDLALRRLGDDEADVVREAVVEAPAPVRNRVGVAERGLHPDLAVAHLDRAGRRVVRPEVERAAALEIEAGVVPMTGQDAVLDASAVEREAHVRASVVEREHAAAIMDHENRAMGAARDEAALRLQVVQAPRKGEFDRPTCPRG